MATSKVEQEPSSWCQPLFDQLNGLNDTASLAPGMVVEGEPEWVWNVARELQHQVMPGFVRCSIESSSARELGVYLGQVCANFYAIGGMLPEPTQSGMEQAAKALEIFNQQRERPGLESVLKLIESAAELIPRFVEVSSKFEKILHDSIKAALDQENYSQAVEFFQGFAKGISKPGISKGRPTGETTATLIYQKLHLHRREVAELANYSELHKFLMRNGVPENVMGSVRRLQKMCERMRLRLGKRGRPRKMRHAP